MIECEVTDEDLALGDYLDVNNCPIVRAVARKIPGSKVKICVKAHLGPVVCWVNGREHAIDPRGLEITRHLCENYCRGRTPPTDRAFGITPA